MALFSGQWWVRWCCVAAWLPVSCARCARALSGSRRTYSMISAPCYKPPLSHFQASPSASWPMASSSVPPARPPPLSHSQSLRCVPWTVAMSTTYARRIDADRLFDQDVWNRSDLATVPSFLVYGFDQCIDHVLSMGTHSWTNRHFLSGDRYITRCMVNDRQQLRHGNK